MMGMDVSGRKPTGERGEYFRSSVWWWHPLADYCQQVAPEIPRACQTWHTNDGDGLDAAGAFALAEALEKDIKAKRTDAYARRYASELQMMPNAPCDWCAGTGVRTLVLHRGTGDPKEVKCSRCQGVAYVRPWESLGRFSTECVAAFAAFLRESGGFVIAGHMPASTEVAMKIARSMEKPNADEMRQEVCDWAVALLQRGASPPDVVEALIGGIMTFAGDCGERAMRIYIEACDKFEKRDDTESPPS
jgi:hypothetical protein